jgi:hypothetical protein
MTSFAQSGMNGYVPHPGYVTPMPGYGGSYNIPNHGSTNNGGAYNLPNSGTGTYLNRQYYNNGQLDTTTIPNNTQDYNQRFHQRESRKDSVELKK